jgi:large subunit ribosomal protein L29
VKAEELRDKSVDELNALVREKGDAIMKFRLQLATGVVDNVRVARNARRDIARIKTVLRQRELGASKGK